MRRFFYAALSCAILAASCATGAKKAGNVSGAVTEFEKYGHAVLDVTAADFLAAGYELGDSVNVTFSNGRKFSGIPFYDGYYVAKGEPMLRAYPGHKNIAVCINYGKMQEVAGLKVGDTAAISLDAKGKYLDVQTLNSLRYTDSREDYSSDEVFANFRSVRVGGIGAGVFYRSCSPVNDEHRRAATADKLAQNAGIETVLNIADSAEEVDSFIAKPGFASPHYASLRRRGRVIPMSMPIDFTSESFGKRLVSGIAAVVRDNLPGPYLIHCTEGKDRAGFTSALLESLMGASYEEVVLDYMKSFENYYGVSRRDARRWGVIRSNNIDIMLRTICGASADADPKSFDLPSGARGYLERNGMTSAEVDALVLKLSSGK